MKQWERFFEGKASHPWNIQLVKMRIHWKVRELDWECCWREPPRGGKTLREVFPRKTHRASCSCSTGFRWHSKLSVEVVKTVYRVLFFSIMKDARVNGPWRFAPRSREQVVDRQCVARLGFWKEALTGHCMKTGRRSLCCNAHPGMLEIPGPPGIYWGKL